ncbi:hypothetical protein ACOSQ3_031855 [Xanthoceras sorbifolium]
MRASSPAKERPLGSTSKSTGFSSDKYKQRPPVLGIPLADAPRSVNRRELTLVTRGPSDSRNSRILRLIPRDSRVGDKGKAKIVDSERILCENTSKEDGDTRSAIIGDQNLPPNLFDFGEES